MRYPIAMFLAISIHAGSFGAMYLISARNPPYTNVTQRLVTKARIISVSSLSPETVKLPAPAPKKAKPKLVKSDSARPTIVPTEVPPEAATLAEDSNEKATDTSNSVASGGEEEVPVLEEGQVNYRHNPRPSYPSQSRRMREEGKVLLKVLVSVEGKVVKCEVMHSSGFERLDLSALEAVKTWLFAPEERSGKPIQSWVLIPVVFRLNT